MSLEKMRRKCQQLTDEERMAILQKATAGTLALLGDNDYPYAVPISYAYREGKQYFHIALAGHKVDAIRKCLTVAKASGAERVVINSGGKSERFVHARYPQLPSQAFVEYGNYIGATLQMAHELDIPRVTLGVMLGKAVKLAAGHLDTHSRKTTMDLAFVQSLLDEAGISLDIRHITLARELWEVIPPSRLQTFATTVIRHCAQHCRPLLPQGELTILLIDDQGHLYSE